MAAVKKDECVNNEELRKFVIKQMKEVTRPLNLEKLIQDGVLVKKGNRYYVLKKLPKHAKQRIKSWGDTKKGSWVTFYKDTKSMEKMRGKLKMLKL